MHQRNVISKRRPAALIVLLGLVLTVAVVALLLRGGTAGANPRSDFVAVSAGALQTCGVTIVGGVECWGRISRTTRDNRTGISEPVPVAIPGLESGNSTVAVGDDEVCVLTDDGGVICWRRSETPLGGVPLPVTISGLDAPAVSVTTLDYESCAVTVTGAVACWGRTSFGGSWDAEPVAGLESNVAAFGQGADFDCALTTSGGVVCAGDNRFGQLGDGTTESRGTFAPVAGLESGVSAIAAGALHNCALTETGAVLCWGDNGASELGGGIGEFSSTPVAVSGLSSGVIAIRAGLSRTCARLDTGSYECWGGPFGSTPATPPGAESGVADVSLGVDHGCLLMEDGRVRCWGTNSLGQLGDGTTEHRNTPVDVVAAEAKAAPTPTPCPATGCPAVTPPPPCAAETCMGLAVVDEAGDVVCHSARNADCDLPAGSDFTLAVDAFAVPEQGYIGVQSLVQFGRYHPQASEDGAAPGSCADWVDNGGDTPPSETLIRADWRDDDCVSADLIYSPADSASDEMVWPDGTLALRSAATTMLAGHGDISGLLPPQTVSTYAGIVVELAMRCSPQESVSDVALLPYGNRFLSTSGAAFAIPPYGEVITPDVSGLRIACCDVTITSVDALFILQFEAGLTGSVSCGWDGDVDADGVVDSIDAALTLQFVAGLLPALPRDDG